MSLTDDPGTITGNGHGGRKPAAVVLWGIGGDTERYLGCLQEAEIAAAACVDGELAGGAFHGVPIVSPAEYARRFYLYRDLPIVVTARGPADQDLFNETVLAISNQLDLPAQILHPVFLADYVTLDFTGRVFIGGFPGAGNITFQTLIAPLLERRAVSHGPRERLFARLGSDYHFHTVLPAVDNLFNLGGRYFSQASTVRGDLIRIGTQHRNARVAMVCNLRSKTYLYEGLHSSHEQLTPETFDLFHRMRWTMVIVVRHPLDIIVSNAAKLSRPPGPILRNLEWFRNMAILVQRYYTLVLDRQHAIGVVKYEELLEYPTQTIRALADAIGVSVTEADAATLWHRTGYRPLVGVDGAGNHHLWRPGCGKWKKFLDARHTEILQELDYEPFLGELGYDRAMHVQPRPAEDPGDGADALPPGKARTAAYGDFGYHVLYQKPVDFRYENFRYENDEVLNITLLTDDVELWRLMEMALGARYFRKLLSALHV